MKSDSINEEVHEESEPNAPISGPQLARLGFIRGRVVPRTLGSLFDKKQKLKPKGGILFRLSKIRLGAKHKDARHENT